MPIRTILVPLDATEFAERAITTARVVAEQSQASLEFAAVYKPELHVSVGGAPAGEPGVGADVRQRLQEYVERVAAMVRSRTTLPVDARLLEGDIVDALAKEVEFAEIDLVVMTTRGRGGLQRLFAGSVADGLIRSISVPVLLVGRHEAGATPAETWFRRVVLALGGNDADEHVLGATFDITDRERTAYTLLHVASGTRMPPVFLPGAPPPPDELAGMPPTLDQAEVQEAEAYLTRLAAPFRAQGVAMDTQVETGRTVADAIIDHAARTSADLIAVATRAPGALERAVLGSVADKVMRNATTSVLVCPPARVVA